MLRDESHGRRRAVGVEVDAQCYAVSTIERCTLVNPTLVNLTLIRILDPAFREAKPRAKIELAAREKGGR